MHRNTENYIRLTSHVVEKIWGGNKLALMKGISKDRDLNLDRIGETWEVSLLKEGPSFGGEGRPISEVVGDNAFDYLVKFIDTSDDLSIQVHPDDDYAKKNEDSLGKTECWFILAADEGCGIYLGLKEGIDREHLERAITNEENVSELLNFCPIKAGDFFFVPAGTIHAIGKGVTLAEVQQSSGITYRVWDWNRLDSEGYSRELHVKKALDVINFEVNANKIESFKIKPIKKNQGIETLVEHRDFSLDIYQFTPPVQIEIQRSKEHRPSVILNLDQPIYLNQEEIKPYQAILIKGDEIFNIQIKPHERGLSDIVSFLYIY